jgi:nucleoside-triphosphatase THEP1
MIQILTGPVRSYKTTTLMQWCAARPDCGGVLSPDVDGLRCLYNVRAKRHIPWQKQERTSDTDIVIGRFVFDPAAFQTAILWLDQHVQDPDINILLIDEIGPLELKGLGWDGWLNHFLLHPSTKDLLLVVRENILDEVVSRYRLQDIRVLRNSDFK